MSKPLKTNHIAKIIHEHENYFKQIEVLEYSANDSIAQVMQKAQQRVQLGIFSTYTPNLKQVTESLKTAVKFRLPDHGSVMQDVTKGKTTPYIIENFLFEQHLPFPVIALEYNTANKTSDGDRYRAGVILVEEVKSPVGERAALHLSILKNIQRNEGDAYAWSILKYTVQIDFNKITADTKDYFDYVKIRMWDETDKTDQKNTLINTEHEIDILLQFLLALSCRNVEINQEYPPLEKENIKRAAKGHPLNYQYNTITIKTTQNQNEKINIGTSSGRTVSPHLRRGHIRRYENKNIWVESTIVKADKADKELTAKQYILK